MALGHSIPYGAIEDSIGSSHSIHIAEKLSTLGDSDLEETDMVNSGTTLPAGVRVDKG